MQNRALERFWISLFFLFSISSSFAFGAGIPFSISDYGDPSAFLTSDVTDPIIKTIGLVTEHRPMDPATPLGTSLGLDLGLAVAATKIPDDFWTAAKKAGYNDDSATGGLAVPVPRLMLHKGIGQSAGLGVSYLGYKNYNIYGADFKYTIYQDDEGPTYAVRLCYTKLKLAIFETTTWSPQILASKKMSFADPYIGIGYSSVTGKIVIPINVPALDQSTTIKGEGKGRALSAFTGVRFFFDLIALELTLEGSYSTAGADTLGLKFGFAF